MGVCVEKTPKNTQSSEDEKRYREALRELNTITLGTIREVADGPDGDHRVCIQFGISRRTADAIRKLSFAQLEHVGQLVGDTFLFAARNADDTLYQLIRSDVAPSDVFLLMKLRTTASGKV